MYEFFKIPAGRALHPRVPTYHVEEVALLCDVNPSESTHNAFVNVRGCNQQLSPLSALIRMLFWSHSEDFMRRVVSKVKPASQVHHAEGFEDEVSCGRIYVIAPCLSQGDAALQINAGARRGAPGLQMCVKFIDIEIQQDSQGEVYVR